MIRRSDGHRNKLNKVRIRREVDQRKKKTRNEIMRQKIRKMKRLECHE